MNAKRRKALLVIITKLEELESLRQEIQERLEEIMDEEQEALDNMPESLQEGERGQQMQEYIDTMDGVNDELDCMKIDELTDQLREIAEV
ncbi:MAG: hypothetical protein ACI4PO_09255 [Faecousia sp.]